MTPVSSLPLPRSPRNTPRGLLLPSSEGGVFPDGPWDQAFWFVVDALRSKSNHRVGDRRRGKSTWSGLAAFENELSATARQHRPRGWDAGDRDQSVAARPRMAVVVFGRSALDTANLDKSVLDALQGPLMVTDAQIAHVVEFSERTTAAPGGLIAVARFAAGTPLTVLARGAIALELACLDILETASPTT